MALHRAALFAACVLVCGWSAPLRAGTDTEAARLAIRTKQFAVAVQSLQPLAAGGLADAQYLLGLALQAGVGAAEDPAGAEKWLRAAAAQQHAAAAFALAGLLASGDAAQRVEAKSWVERAATLGYPAAIAAKRSDTLPLAVTRPDVRADATLRRAFAFYAARTNDVEGLRRIGTADLANVRDEFGRTPLAAAAEHGSAAVVALLLKSAANVNAQDAYGVTPLMLAAAQPDRLTTQQLIGAGARLEALDQAGRTALMCASWADQATQVDVLAAAGAALNAVDPRGWTALDVAIQRDRTKAAERLRALGAVAKLGLAAQPRSAAGLDPTRSGALYKDWAPLLIAVSRDDLDSMQRLLASGASADATTPQGDSAVHVAIESGSSGALRALLRAHADVRRRNAGGETPLMLAARRDDLEALKLLLAARTDAEGVRSAVLDSARQGDARTLAVLLAAGADANVVDAAKDPALILAVRAANASSVVALLGAGAKVDVADAPGRAALWYAAAAGQPEIVDALLRARARIDGADAEGATPLIVAASQGHAAVVEKLLAAGASAASVTRRGDTALLSAARAGHADVVAVLLKDRSALDKANSFGDTPLMAASRGGFANVCELLLRAGANTRLRNRDRATASDVAQWRGFTALAKQVGGG